MFSTCYNDWICKRVHSTTLDGYTEVVIKDMQGEWRVVARFDEADDYMTTKVHDCVTSWLYKGQPFRHDTTTV